MDRLTKERIEQIAKFTICRTDGGGVYVPLSPKERDALCDLALQSLSLESVREEVLEEAAKVADSLAHKWHLDYKVGHGPHRASAHREGMSDGADEIANEIRALQSPARVAEGVHSTELRK